MGRGPICASSGFNGLNQLCQILITQSNPTLSRYGLNSTQAGPACLSSNKLYVNLEAKSYSLPPLLDISVRSCI